MATRPEYPKTLIVFTPGAVPGAKPSLDRVVVHSIDDESLALFGTSDRKGAEIAFDVTAFVPAKVDLRSREGMTAAIEALGKSRGLPPAVAKGLGV